MNERSRFILRVVAGLYLVYLGVKMIQGLMVDKPENMMLMLSVAVVFVIVGVLFVISSARNMKSFRNAEPPQEETDVDYVENTPELENKVAETAEDKNDETDEVPEADEEESGGEEAELEAADEEER